ncbi:aminoglycoside/multidrug efflux system [Enterobacter cloacae]|uniref:Aminoglycoside/multidrug efflux system n=1 Tax=Enterobacter cloacae TaxID=550 RepID=A0A377LXV4_ENTCL|nr:aminoglycoside/multidrug efflux system [Enterobacter cloacae]
MLCCWAVWCGCSCICRLRSCRRKTGGCSSLRCSSRADQRSKQTLKVVQKVEQYFFTKEKDNVVSVFSTVGSGPGGNGAERCAYVCAPERLGRTRYENGHLVCHYRTRDQSLLPYQRGSCFCQQPTGHQRSRQFCGFDMELQDHAGAGHTGADGGARTNC